MNCALRYSFSTIAAVYSFVDAFPPRSPVIVFPSAIVYNGLSGQQMNRKPVTETYREGRLLDFVGMSVQVHVPQHH